MREREYRSSEGDEGSLMNTVALPEHKAVV